MTGGSGLGEATDQRPFSGPLESAPIRAGGPFSGPQCASCPASLAAGEEGLLSRHLFFSPSVDLAEAIDIFGAGFPDAQGTGEHFEVDNVASSDDVFPGSKSEFSRSGASTEATVVPRESPRRMADLFGEIMGEAAAIKGIPMPAPPLNPMSDDMQGECFHTLSSSRLATQCLLFPPVQHLFTAAAGDPSTLKAPVRAFTDFTNVEGWADTRRGIPRLEPSLAALLCLGAGWLPNEKPLPPDRLQKKITGLTDRVEAYGPEEARMTVSRFFSAILQLCQPVAVSAGPHMAWATMIQRAIWLSHTAVPERVRASLVQGPLAPDGLFGPRFSEVLAHRQSVRENRSRFGAILTGSSHQQAGRKRGPRRFQRSRGPPPPPTPMPQQQSQQQQQQQQQPPPQPGRAAPRGQKFRKLAPTFPYPNNKEKKDCSTERQYILPKERYSFK
ncbi:unnamed protein product [Boreogadus saida]